MNLYCAWKTSLWHKVTWIDTCCMYVAFLLFLDCVGILSGFHHVIHVSMYLSADCSERQDGRVHQHPGHRFSQCCTHAHAPETQRHSTGLPFYSSQFYLYFSCLSLCSSLYISSFLWRSSNFNKFTAEHNYFQKHTCSVSIHLLVFVVCSSTTPSSFWLYLFSTQDYTHEFHKTKGNFLAIREREDLLGSVRKDIEWVPTHVLWLIWPCI